MIKPLDTILYTAQTHTIGGRQGHGTSSDGQLDVALGSPGSNKPGTNPEQLFGVGYSACFMGAMQIAGGKLGLKLPEGTAIDASVSLGKTDGGNAYALAVKLVVSLPGLDPAVQRQLVDAAHQTCPYSAAIRGNVDVQIELA